MVDNESYTPVKFTKEGSYFYYYDENGNKVTGVQKINGFYYLFGTVDGVLKTEWQSPNGIRYYYSTEDGNPVFGIVKWHGRFYYVDEQEGKIVNKTITIDGLDYTFDENGILTNDSDIDVKDKLVTLESLGLLHLYAENTYMKKEENVGITYHNSEHGEIFNDYEDNVASGQYSSASGAMTSATGDFSNANGNMTTASGDASESSGINSVASGLASNANNSSTASGDYSSSYGYYTVADSDHQFTLGKFNVIDSENKYAFIVGNGENNSNRSNAFTVDWDGNINADGDVVATESNGEEVSLIDTANLANNLDIYAKNKKTILYINIFNGNDDNDGLSSESPLKTLDKVIELVGYYRNVLVILQGGYEYTATDKTNEYGSGIHLYNCSVKFKTDNTIGTTKINNSIFVYNGNLEVNDVNFLESNSCIILYNSFCILNECTAQRIEPHNSIVSLHSCISPYLLQYGGYTSVYGGKIDSIQSNDSGLVNCEGFFPTGTVGYSILKNGINIFAMRAKRIAEDSTSTITRYVNATSGSDGSPGTENAPYRTLKEALDDVMYARKAIIYLASGTYTIPNKTLNLVKGFVHIIGNSSSDTIIKGNFYLDNSYLKLTDITLDCTDETYADITVSAPIRMFINSKICLENAIISTTTAHCVSATESSEVYGFKTSFIGSTSYAVNLTGNTSATIYRCTDESGKGLSSSYGCRAYMINSPNFSYRSGLSGMVYVDGQQVLPQTAETAAILSMGENA